MASQQDLVKLWLSLLLWRNLTLPRPTTQRENTTSSTWASDNKSPVEYLYSYSRVEFSGLHKRSLVIDEHLLGPSCPPKQGFHQPQPFHSTTASRSTAPRQYSCIHILEYSRANSCASQKYCKGVGNAVRFCSPESSDGASTWAHSHPSTHAQTYTNGRWSRDDRRSWPRGRGSLFRYQRLGAHVRIKKNHLVSRQADIIASSLYFNG